MSMPYERTNTEQLLGTFQAYLAHFSLQFAYFESVSNPQEMVAGYFPAHAATQCLTVVGQRMDASLAVLWQSPASVALSELPVVWLSSDGVPNGVISNSLPEFLSILPYGTAFIITALDLYNDRIKASGERIRLSDELPVRKAEEYWTRAQAEDFEGHERFINWLRTIAVIEPTKNPIAIIEQALQTHPHFDEWYEAQVTVE